jgi:hypothetical protein
MKYLAILLFSVILSGCGVKVNIIQDESVDFSKYKTFCWLEGCEFTYTGPRYLDDSLWRETIKEAIIAELEGKGLVRDENNPDLLIDFHISVQNETSVVYHHIDDQYDYNPFPEDEIINYLKETMIMHMMEREQGKMVWKSESIGYMDEHPELTEKNIRKGIALTLKKFPGKE